MSTIQMIGIGIAVGILIILVIALIITRRRDAAGGGKTKEKKEAKKEAKQPHAPPADLTPETASFLEGAPRDDLHMLRGEKAPEPAAEGAATAAGPAVAEEQSPSPGLWAEHQVESPSRSAPAELWGSAAAAADAQAVAVETAAGATAEGASAPAAAASEGALGAEPLAAGMPGATPLAEDTPEAAGAALPMFAAQADADTATSVRDEAVPLAEPPVAPYATEPPPPWEQPPTPSYPSEPVETPPATTEPWAADTTPTEAWAAAEPPSTVGRPGEPWGSAPEGPPAAEMPGVGSGAADDRVVVAPWVIDPDGPAQSAAEQPAEAPAPTSRVAGDVEAVRPITERPFAQAAERPFAVEATADAPAPSVTEPVALPKEPAVETSSGAPAEAAPAAAMGGVAQAPASTAPAAARKQPKLVALSSIISTTNQQMVDLNDAEVRRMLKELAKSEIDLAQQYKSLGQNIDAVLQLTEARKICDALDMASHAKLIDQMIQEVQS